MKIAIDVMGADYSPLEQIMGAVEWQAEHPEDELLLVGDEAAITAGLAEQEVHPGRIRVVPATQVITMNEHPAASLRTKKDASILVATKLVKAGEADAVVSCGNTGRSAAPATYRCGSIHVIRIISGRCCSGPGCTCTLRRSARNAGTPASASCPLSRCSWLFPFR